MQAERFDEVRGRELRLDAVELAQDERILADKVGNIVRSLAVTDAALEVCVNEVRHLDVEAEAVLVEELVQGEDVLPHSVRKNGRLVRNHETFAAFYELVALVLRILPILQRKRPFSSLRRHTGTADIKDVLLLRQGLDDTIHLQDIALAVMDMGICTALERQDKRLLLHLWRLALENAEDGDAPISMLLVFRHATTSRLGIFLAAVGQDGNQRRDAVFRHAILLSQSGMTRPKPELGSLPIPP